MEQISRDQEIIALFLDQINVDNESIVYDDEGKVIELNFSGCNLTMLPTGLGQLTNLQALDLSNNELREVPTELGGLNNLQTLDLSENQLREVPTELGELSNLRELFLNNNSLREVPAELGKLSNLQVLNLNRNQLREVPAELGKLKNLWELNLSENELRRVPAELGILSNLRRLSLNENQLREIPAELGKLSNLRILWLNNNALREVPAELGHLSNLKELFLNNNQLRKVPEKLWKLTNLQTLYLGRNQLSEVPAELGQLINLQTLSLSDNRLKEIPAELGQLTGLQTLSIDSNQLREVPAELEQLTNLQRLYLNNNKLSEVPAELGQLTNLQTFLLYDNPLLLTPPPEIVSQGMQAILTFLQALYKENIRQKEHTLRFEAKLILVGEGGTGKSSLLRALLGESFIESLETTHGIEVEPLPLPHPTVSTQSLTLNCWDFGGQDIYRATHQFFLTKRSLYLVVWNARTEAAQGKLDYWLKTIGVLAPDAPVLLVATHIDERRPDLNVPQYLSAYKQIVDVVQISNKTGEGIDDLKRKLAIYAAELPLMGQPWPRSWVEVEQALLANPHHHISATSYMDLCMAKGVQAELSQGTLGSYLHDLGKILYFRDDPILRDIVVLKANWVTKAISMVLEDKKTIEANGILTHADLPTIWAVDEQGRRYDPALHRIFLRLMERFELCYQIESPFSGDVATQSLIPQLLPYQPPASLPEWIPADMDRGLGRVTMTFRLDFVPAGIMSWLIVRTHRYTRNLHWRDGAVLGYQEHLARVELFPMLNELRLEVWGVEPHTFFVILKDTIDLILSRFEGLHIKREVPCNCHIQTGETQPCTEVYRYEEDLIRRLKRNRQTLECPASGEDVSIPGLLYGIHSSTTPQVIATIQGHQEILLHLKTIESKEDRLLQQNDLLWLRLNQLCEWNVRQFTRLWNLEMKKMEAECPNTFFLVPGSTTPFTYKNWISHDYKLFLMCQHPSGPHCMVDSQGYDLRQAKEWWVKVAPWLKHLITFLKFGVPMAGAVLGVALSDDEFKQIEKQVELLEKITDDLPEIVESDSGSFAEKHHMVGQEQVLGPSLRVLHNFLKEVDPQEYWDGLHKIVTPDGNILWLCEEHARPYQVQPLQL